MKTLLLFVLSSIFSTVIFAQTITWSPDLVKPKETEVNSFLSFPGTDANNYYANESVVGTRLIKRKWKDFVKTVDITSLKVVKETDLTGELPDDGKEYLNARNFIYQNKQYNFFIDMNDQKTYQVYSVIQNMDGSKASNVKPYTRLTYKNSPFLKVLHL